jgi:hypothetical protein
MKDMDKTVKFNIGGRPYTVTRSLLDLYPNTMLARSASKHWQEDSETEIFIERDGSIFRFVLNYMRDGKVNLPITESREAVIDELEYYGIEVLDDCNINDADFQKATCIKSFRDAVRDLEQLCEEHERCIINAELELRCTKYALDVLQNYMLQGETKEREISFNFVGQDQRENVSSLLKMNRHKEIRDMVNSRLKFVGLKIAVFDAEFGSEYMDARVVLVDLYDSEEG